jgi:hypothetical protein
VIILIGGFPYQVPDPPPDDGDDDVPWWAVVVVLALVAMIVAGVAVALASPAFAGPPFTATLVCLPASSGEKLEFDLCSSHEECDEAARRFIDESYDRIQDTCKGHNWEIEIR